MAFVGSLAVGFVVDNGSLWGPYQLLVEVCCRLWLFMESVVVDSGSFCLLGR